MLSGSLATTAGRCLSCELNRRPPDKKGSGQRVKHSVSGSGKGAIKGYKPTYRKILVCYKIQYHPRHKGWKKGCEWVGGNIVTR
jgi:hypothetical protein